MYIFTLNCIGRGMFVLSLNKENSLWGSLPLFLPACSSSSCNRLGKENLNKRLPFALHIKVVMVTLILTRISEGHAGPWGVGRVTKPSFLPSAPRCPAANAEETFPAGVTGPCGDLHPLTPLQLIHPHDLSASTGVTLTLSPLWHGSAFKTVMIRKASLLGPSCDYIICHRPEGVINTSGHWAPTRDKAWKALCQMTYLLPLRSNSPFSFTYKSTWWGRGAATKGGWEALSH